MVRIVRTAKPEVKRRVVRRSNGSTMNGSMNGGVASNGKKIVRRSSKKILNAHPEALLISAIINTGDYMTPVGSGVRSFLFHAYPDEWEYIENYINRYRRTPSEASFLRRFPEFEVIPTSDTDEHIEDVKESHARHTLLTAMDNVAEHIQSGKPIDKLVRATEIQLIELQSQLAASTNEASLTKDWELAYKEAQRRVNRVKKGGQAGIATGFPTLDDSTGGPQPGEYWVLASRLGQGKTWTCVNMAVAAAARGSKVQFNALEQSRVQVMLRVHNLLSGRTGGTVFRSTDISKGSGYDLWEYRKFLRSIGDQLKNEFIIDDTPRGKVNIGSIASQIERNQPDIVFIDYITLMESDNDDWRAIKRLSADIKGLTQQYQIPIVCAAQINRTQTAKNAPPSASGLSGSDAIGQDADAIVTLSRPTTSVVRLRLDKYRHGPDGIQWWCHFNIGNGRYEEVSGDQAQELMDRDKDED